MPRRITRDNLGAWLLRCNPKSEPELTRLIAQGGHRIQRWCVADNYRSRVMAAGDSVLFWVSGDGRQVARGIWGSGQVLDVVGCAQQAGAPAGARAAASPGRPSADVDIPLFAAAVSDQEIRAAGIDDLEVQVQPQGANPSWVSAGQFVRLSAAFPLLLESNFRVSAKLEPDCSKRE